RESYVLQLPQSQKIRKTALRSCRISAPANGRSTKAHHDKPITQRSPQGGGEQTESAARADSIPTKQRYAARRFFFAPVCFWLARRAGVLGAAFLAGLLACGSPAVCGRATAASPFICGRPAAAHIASAFCSRVTQYSQARSTPRAPRLCPPHFSASPADSGPSVPIAIARSCSSALRVV